MSAIQNYRVSRGDTLTDIAAAHGVSPEALMRANGMNPALADGRVSRNAADPDRLQVDQVLRIPVATPGLERQHRVAPGESLLDIAKRWGVELLDLLHLNPHVAGAAGQPGAPAGAAPTADAGAKTAATATTPAATGTAGRLDLKAFTNPELGSNAPAAIVIGNAEGTRKPDGGFRGAFNGHADPGNAKHNLGSFSYQDGGVTTAAQADRKQLQVLTKALPNYERAAKAAGLDPANPRLASAYLDLYNQSKTAAGRFLDRMGSLSGKTLDVATLTQARVDSFINPRSGERYAGAAGGFVNIARKQVEREPTAAEIRGVVHADQLRREKALEGALSKQGLLTGTGTAPATASKPAAALPPAAAHNAPAGSTGAGSVAKPDAAAAPAGQPKWLTVALGERGVKEIRGSEDSPRVLEYHQATSLKAKDDETSWCSSFVNWSMKQAGVQGTNSAAARSWLNWGEKVTPDAAHVKPGDVIVFPRGNNPAFGHVAIVKEVLGDGQVMVVGGNQTTGKNKPDGVTESVRNLADAIGVRRAP